MKWATAGGGSGRILQTVTGTSTTETTLNTTTFTDTTLSASITPASTGSKILVLISQNYFLFEDTVDAVGGSIQVLRGSTNIYDNDGSGNALGMYFVAARTGANSDAVLQNYFSVQLVDSPSTTSSVTYKTQMRMYATSGVSLVVQKYSAKSIITLLEIGA